MAFFVAQNWNCCATVVYFTPVWIELGYFFYFYLFMTQTVLINDTNAGFMSPIASMQNILQSEFFSILWSKILRKFYFWFYLFIISPPHSTAKPLFRISALRIAMFFLFIYFIHNLFFIVSFVLYYWTILLKFTKRDNHRIQGDWLSEKHCTQILGFIINFFCWLLLLKGEVWKSRSTIVFSPWMPRNLFKSFLKWRRQAWKLRSWRSSKPVSRPQ